MGCVIKKILHNLFMKNKKSYLYLWEEFKKAKKAFLHPKTPFIAKLLLSLGILGYVIMPMDALPDFILFLWLADDVVIIPILIWVFMKFVPQEVMDSVRTPEQK